MRHCSKYVSVFYVPYKSLTFGGEIINAGGAGFRKRLSAAISKSFPKYYSWIPPPDSDLVKGTTEYTDYMIEKLTALKTSLVFCHADKVSPNFMLSYTLH